MKVVFKYEILQGTVLEIKNHGGDSRPLKVKNINGRIFMWFLHDNSVNRGEFINKYRAFNTGDTIENFSIYIDTFFIDDLVFHVFGA